MTAITPVYGLKYIEVGEPIRNTRQALEDNAKSIEAALIAGGVAAPGASDLLTLSGRVSTLENGVTAEDNAVGPLSYSTGFSQFTSAPYGEVIRCWHPTPGTVRVTGIVGSANAIVAGSANVPMFTLPVGFRPAARLLRTVWYAPGATGGSAPVYFRCHIETTGIVNLIAHTAVVANAWFQLQDFEFRTVNT